MCSHGVASGKAANRLICKFLAVRRRKLDNVIFDVKQRLKQRVCERRTQDVRREVIGGFSPGHTIILSNYRINDLGLQAPVN